MRLFPAWMTFTSHPGIETRLCRSLSGMEQNSGPVLAKIAVKCDPKTVMRGVFLSTPELCLADVLGYYGLRE